MEEQDNYKPVSVGLERAAQQYILSPFYIRNYDAEMYSNDYRSEVIQTQIHGGTSSVPPLPGPQGPQGPPGAPGGRARGALRALRARRALGAPWDQAGVQARRAAKALLEAQARRAVQALQAV